MDPFLSLAQKNSEAARHLRSYEHLRNEGVRELEAFARAVRPGATLRHAVEACIEQSWHRFPDARDVNAVVAKSWSVEPRGSNSFFPGAFMPDANLASERSTLVTSTGSLGGYAVGTSLHSAHETHDAAGHVLGLMTIETAAGNAGNQIIGKFPSLPAASVLATQTSTASDVGPSDAAQSVLSPKNIVCFGKFSRQWIQQTPQGAASLARLFVNAERTKLVTQICNGAGTSGELLGLTANPAVATVVGTSVDWSDILTTLDNVEKNSSGAGLAWVVSNAAAKVLRARDGVSGATAMMVDNKIAGYPVHTIGDGTNAYAVFGAWRDLQVFQWAPLELEFDIFSSFQSPAIGVRAWISADAAPVITGSFSTITSIT
jgi:HK97 family phage major capsid protein